MTKINILILGSAPDATNAKHFNRKDFDKIIVINNAWKIRDDFDYHIFPNDFPITACPKNKAGKNITYLDYVPAQNRFGGFVYAGGTMAFTAGYWALSRLNPKLIAYLGCDMIYRGPKTHFYGKGTADPLRDDITLKNLLAKSCRLEALATENQCSVVNLSQQESSNLIFRRSTPNQIHKNIAARRTSPHFINQAKELESNLNYFVEDGKYWKHLKKFDSNKLDQIDQLWLSSIIT